MVRVLKSGADRMLLRYFAGTYTSTNMGKPFMGLYTNASSLNATIDAFPDTANTVGTTNEAFIVANSAGFLPIELTYDPDTGVLGEGTNYTYSGAPQITFSANANNSANLTWTVTANDTQTIRGYVIYFNSTPKCPVFWEQFTSSNGTVPNHFVPQNAGDTLVVNATIKFGHGSDGTYPPLVTYVPHSQ